MTTVCLPVCLQYCIRFSRAVNKKLLMSVTTEMRKWVHEDPENAKRKLTLLRTLTSEDEADKDLLQKCRAFVGGALVSYAKGSPSIKTVKPYGLKAFRYTSCFKAVPSRTLALTFAALYQTVRTPPHLLEKWIKTPRPNITEPWPRGMMQRFVLLQQAFLRFRDAVFAAYEQAGGEYMDEDLQVQKTKHTPRKCKIMEDFEEDFE